MEMMEQGAPPPQAGPPQGGEGEGEAVIKKAAAGFMTQAQGLMKGAELFAQVGAPEGVSAKMQQASELIMAAMQEMGVGGNAGAAPAPSGNPDTAGVPGAQPVGVGG